MIDIVNAKCHHFFVYITGKFGTITTMERRSRSRRNGYQGMNWCHPTTRLAIYLRDGLACAWCSATVEDGTQLTLDHVRTYSAGGSNAATNLITACKRCNSSRGDRSIKAFAGAVAEYLNHEATPAAILAHIKTCLARELPRAEARELIARRGTVAKAIKP